MEIFNQEDFKKPYVRFGRIAKENKVKSLEAGHYVADDIDMVYVTPPGSKDVFEQKVKLWFDQLERDVANQRIPMAWVEDYRKAYDYFLKGQEMPLDGIPVRGWGIISPAQQETLIRLHILTVNQLAVVNEEAVRRIGMGGQDLKNKAQAWLKTLDKSGSASLEIAELRKENITLRNSIEILMEKVSKLTSALNVTSEINAPGSFIDMKDILSDTPSINH